MIRALALLFTLATVAGHAVPPDWTAPLAPFQIADNLYYVGSRDLAAYLVTTSAGNILVNANLESSPPQIKASIEKLGFRYADTKILLNGQAHYDHMAGAAQILRETHARDMVMDGDVAAAESGGRRDFAAKSNSLPTYPPVHVDRILHDHDTVTLGNTTLTALRTAGHTRGCTTYVLRAHLHGDPLATLRTIVIVGGLQPLSGYRLVDAPGQPASYPGIADDFRRTYATLRALHPDLFLGAHGVYFHLLDKLPTLAIQGAQVFVDSAAYNAAIDDAEKIFVAQLAKQQAATEKPPLAR